MIDIFINYRTSDAAHGAAACYEILAGRFGAHRVFRDCASIIPGQVYPTEINSALAETKVLVAIIGPDWLAEDAGGERLVDRPSDWVRREIARALSRRILIVPVLLDETNLPPMDSLPADIRALACCQVARVRHQSLGPDIKRLGDQIVRLVPELGQAGTATHPIVPHQLPMMPRWLVGRDEELALLDTTLAAGDAAGETVVVVVEGVGGIGKTTLGLRWAHQHANRFPDGELYGNLRGFDPTEPPARPLTLLRGFLMALGIDPQVIPGDEGGVAGLYRSVLAGRRMMIVLDNVWDAEQVVPLLPGTASCVVLVTSRNHLAGLRVLGATFVRLETLTDEYARALLSRQLPTDAFDAEPAAASMVLQRCGGLPLALTIVAARTADHPGFPLSHLADELRDESAGLSAFATGDRAADLRAVLSWSSASLDDAESRAFRFLGVSPFADIGLPAAACLWAADPAEATRWLRSLEMRNLVREHAPKRFQMHDLVRRHAAELATLREHSSARAAALHRLASFYAHTARTADHMLYPYRFALDRPELLEGCHPIVLADEPGALSWFAEEHQHLLVIQQTAARHGWSELVWHIAHSLDTYQYRMGYLPENIESSKLGLAAAEALGRPRLWASSLRQMGRALTRAGEWRKAESALRQALDIEIDTGYQMGQAHAHHDLQRVYSLNGDHERALRHSTSALTLYQALNNEVGQAHALNAQGRQHAQLGRFERARWCCESALGLHTDHGNTSGLIATLDTLGYIAHKTNRIGEAAEYYTHALAMSKQFGNRFAEAALAEQLAQVLTAHGEHDGARQALRKAHELYEAQHRPVDAKRVLDELNSAARR